MHTPTNQTMAPQTSMDAEAMEAAWVAAMEAGGPVHLIVGMPEPDHSRTVDPLTEKSPLVRLSLAALEMGIDPERLEFHDPSTITAPINTGCALTMGEREVFRNIHPPRKVYSYCALNDMLFGDWIGVAGDQAIRYEHRNFTARWDGGPQQVAVMERIASFLEGRGYSDAAIRARLACAA